MSFPTLGAEFGSMGGGEKSVMIVEPPIRLATATKVTLFPGWNRAG